ncbi:hypothetical protein JTB14_006793 [Gonioctena quinquepunctata]|nr:hypothetical protein JTB14_006793 [Gonioctena quinquepunctata]
MRGRVRGSLISNSNSDLESLFAKAIMEAKGFDSLSAINTLEDPFTLNVWAIKILEINTNLTSTNKMVTIMWVPSHTNITGNELADSAAKDATTNMVDAGIPVPLEDVKKYVKQKFTEVWQNHWNEYDGQLRRIKPSIEKWFYPRELSRREQVTLCRTRIGHTNLTHLYLLAGSERPRCNTCRVRLTVHHFLSCPDYELHRHQTGITSPEIEITFRNENEAIQKFLTFLKRTELLKKM